MRNTYEKIERELMFHSQITGKLWNSPMVDMISKAVVDAAVVPGLLDSSLPTTGQNDIITTSANGKIVQCFADPNSPDPVPIPFVVDPSNPDTSGELTVTPDYFIECFAEGPEPDAKPIPDLADEPFTDTQEELSFSAVDCYVELSGEALEDIEDSYESFDPTICLVDDQTTEESPIICQIEYDPFICVMDYGPIICNAEDDPIICSTDDVVIDVNDDLEDSFIWNSNEAGSDKEDMTFGDDTFVECYVDEGPINTGEQPEVCGFFDCYAEADTAAQMCDDAFFLL